MLTITGSIEVSRIAVEAPETIEVLQKLGIDFCCKGKRPLEQACKEAGLKTCEVISQLITAPLNGRFAEQHYWDKAPLTLLSSHIVREHHQFTRNEFERLNKMMVKVAKKHGKEHPELIAIMSLFIELQRDLQEHMLKEELLVFPYIDSLEKVIEASRAPNFLGLKSMASPVEVMIAEHEKAGELMQQIRSLSDDYEVPANACPTYVGLYQGLLGLENDLHVHVHLENNILFPRALVLEKKVKCAA